MKTCTKCRETKDFSEFHKNKSRKDGYNSHCKECVKKHYLDLKQNQTLQLKREIYRTVKIENKILEKDCKKLCGRCKDIFNINELSDNGICKKCQNEYSKQYQKTEKGKIKLSEYRKTDKSKEYTKKYQKEYAKTEKRMETVAKYRQTDSYKVSIKKYTDKTKEKKKEYHKQWYLKKKLEKLQQN